MSGRCAAMIGGMCRFTRLRGRVPTSSGKKQKTTDTVEKRRKPNSNDEEEGRKGKQRKDDAGSARRRSYNLMQRGYKGDYAHRWL